jgi:hypothetical protein
MADFGEHGALNQADIADSEYGYFHFRFLSHSGAELALYLTRDQSRVLLSGTKRTAHAPSGSQ